MLLAVRPFDKKPVSLPISEAVYDDNEFPTPPDDDDDPPAPPLPPREACEYNLAVLASV